MKFKISKKKFFILIPIIALIVITIVIFSGNKKEVTTKITKVLATKGTIINTISGSGTILPIEEYYIVSTVKGDILSDNVTVGEECPRISESVLTSIPISSARVAKVCLVA